MKPIFLKLFIIGLLVLLALGVGILLQAKRTRREERLPHEQTPAAGVAERGLSETEARASFEKSVATRVPFFPVNISDFFEAGFIQEGYYVIGSGNWREYFSQKTSRTDLEKNIYIGVSLGERPTGGYSVSIVDVNQVKNQVFVTLGMDEPDPDEFVIQVITNPYQFVGIEKSALKRLGDLEFVFVDIDSIKKKTINLFVE